ncbi:MAG TPA: acyltransferase domain-containing protein, partial [Kofleriaceae bacterium]
MAAPRALAALEQELAAGEATAIVADVDWGRLATALIARPRSLLDELPGARRALETRFDGTSPSGGDSDLAVRLRGRSEREQLDELLALVRAETAAVLGYADADRVDLHKGFAELGLSSLSAVEFRQRLSRATGLRLPATVSFDHPSPRHVAVYLREQLVAARGQPAATGANGHAQRASERDGAGSQEPLAIIGMGLRLPGGVADLDGLFRMLARGLDAVGPIPAERWDTDRFYDPDFEQKGKSYVRDAALLDRIDLFDAGFFGISPREARHIDPQHRLLLEAAWQALEDAGLPPPELEATPTGVFVGVGPSDYGRLGGGDDAYTVLGTHSSFAAGRLAFTLRLHGPALAVDTACSSSLVALHLACQALRRGECNLALAAGVQVLAAPEPFVLMSRTRALAPDGRSKTFSARADGYGRGEGVVVLALQRLCDARARGNRIMAVVRGSAVNHDGQTSGITVPNGTSQQKVLRAALADARLSPAEVDVVECHGTGTALGDPIEVQALAAVYGEQRDPGRPLLLGAVKTNIGHLESAAGLAGVAKVVAALRHEALPPTLHTTPRNPHVDWDRLAVRVVDTVVPWPKQAGGRPRRAGVSAFGLSGTNAHVILEEAAQVAAELPAAPSAPLPPDLPFVLSGKSEVAVRGQAARLAAHLADRPGTGLIDLAYSLATTRTHFEHRAAVVGHDQRGLVDALEALGRGSPTPATVLGERHAPGEVVFVFPGQGSQWAGMARALRATSSVFREQLEACERALAAHVDPAVLAVLRDEASCPDRVDDRVDVVQPALFAVMVSLAALWRSAGVAPGAVVGHSQGEIAAAFVAGALSLEDAARVVAVRSRALTRLAGGGAMAAIELGASEVEAQLAPFGRRLSIAAINSPRSTLISGEPEAIEQLLGQLAAAQVFARKVRVDYASHGAQVEAIAEQLVSELGDIAPRATAIPLYSTVTGALIDGRELTGAYWYRNLRQTVRFAEAEAGLLASGRRFFVEVSPHPVLTLAMEETGQSQGVAAVVVGTLRRDQGDYARFLLSLGQLHAGGCEVDWRTFFDRFGPRSVELPTYAFQRARFWLEETGQERADVAAAGQAAMAHPLVGAAVELADTDGVVFTGRLSLGEQRWLAGHRVFGEVILPGTAFVE